MSPKHQFFAVWLALAALLTVPTIADAYDFGTITAPTPGTTYTTPAGVTVTAAATGATSISTPADPLTTRGAIDANFTPQIPAGNVAFRPLVNVSSCGTIAAGSTVVCSGLGTLTISFSRPVRNPTIHIAGLGGSFASGPTTIRFHATTTLTGSSPAGASLGSVLAGATNLTVAGGQIRGTNDNLNASCATAGAALATSACGSVSVNGTVTSLTFAIGARLVTVPSGSLALGATAADAFGITASMGQDYGDAPTSYDAGAAAGHDLSDLTLGSTIDEDAASTLDPTASPNSVAAGSSASGAAGDGADEDAFTTWPTLTTAAAGGSYAVTVPVSGVSGAARLCGWIDFDRSGTFASGERACANVAAAATSAPLTWSVPTATSAGTLYARLRLGYTQAQVDAPTGLADSGEVEDYSIAMFPSVRVLKTKVGGGADTFDLRVNGSTQATAVGNGGTTPVVSLFHTSTFGAPTLTVGQNVASQTVPFTFSEVASGGNVYGFSSAWACVDGAGTSVASGSGTSGSGTLPQSSAANARAQDIRCTFTNTALPPALTLNKSASAVNDVDSNGVDVGDTVTFSFSVTNTGGAPLTSVSVSDPTLAGAVPSRTISCAASSLAVGATTTCTASGPYTLTQADVDAGALNNTATATGTPPSGPAVTDTDSTSTALSATPQLTVTKTAGAVNDLDGNGDDAGDTITYSFVLRNTGNVTLSALSLTDPLLGGAITCPGTTLAPGAQMTCSSATYTITAGDMAAGSRSNTATASWTAPSGATGTASGSANVALTQTPAITVDKTATTATTPAPFGASIAYSFVVQNTGNVPLTAVSISDPTAGTVTCPGTTLAAGASMTCTAPSHTVTVGDLLAGSVNNTATATGTPPSGPAVTATDSAVVPTNTTPRLQLDKSAGAITDVDSNGTDAGDQITYAFLVTNNGGRTVNGLTISDTMLAGAAPVVTISCPGGALLPGDSVTCTTSGPYTLKQSDLDAGAANNTATVSGTPAGGGTVTDSDSTSTALVSAPGVVVDKTASGVVDLDGNGVDAGDRITYSFAVTNTGNVTLSSVAVSDPLLGGAVPCAGASPLAPGATFSCPSVNYTLTQADLDAGSRGNTASITANPPTDSPVTGTDSTSTALPPAASMTLAKSAGGFVDVDGNGPDAGDTVTFTFVVTNTSNVTLSSVAVSDPMVPSISCPAGALAPGAQRTCTAAPYVLTQANVNAGAVNNTATAAAQTPAGGAVTAQGSATVTIPRTTTMVFDKTAGSIVDADSNGPDAGDTITYGLTVRNTGNVTLTAVAVTDAKLGAVTCPGGGLAPGATVACTAAVYTLTQADVDAGAVNNVAFASATGPTGSVLNASDSTSVAIAPGPGFTIDKTASAVNDVDVNGVDAGDTINYTFVLRNTGNVTMNAVAVSDPLLGAVSCPQSTIPPGATVTCGPVPYTITQADIDVGQRSNTATANATAPDGSAVSRTDTVVVPLARNPLLSVDKTASAIADLDANGQDAGDRITYGFTVVNTGNVTLTAIAVTDPLLGAITCPQSTLAPGAAMTCTSVNYLLTQADVDAGARSNTARVQATPPTGGPIEAFDLTSTSITPGPALSLTKQAAPINDVDGNGDDAGDTITYSFVLRNTGNVTLSSLAVTDPKVPGITCPSTTLAPGATTTCTAAPYVLQSTDIDNGEATNSASASGTAPNGATAAATGQNVTPVFQRPLLAMDKHVMAISDPDSNGQDAGDVISYELVATNAGNVTLSGVTITDPLLGALSCTPASPGTIAVGSSMVCTGSYTLAQPDMDAGARNNTATVNGTAPGGASVSASDSVSTALSPGPAVLVNKSAGPVQDLDSNGTDVGDQITYSFDVRNVGNVTLSSPSVSDPLFPGGVTCPSAPIVPGANAICGPATYTLTQADVDAGVRTNSATVTAQPPLPAPPVTATDGTSTPLVRTPELTLDKIAGTLQDVDGNGPDAGDTITYTFNAANVGNVTVTGLAISDPLVGTVTCPSTTLAPATAVVCTAAPHVVTQTEADAGAVNNTATATASSPSGAVPPTPTASDSTSSPVAPTASLELTKTASAVNDVDANGTDAGDTITYGFTVRNAGTVTLSSIVVSDALLGPVTCPTPPAPGLAPGATLTCTSQIYTLAQTDVNGGVRRNLASATAQTPFGQTVRSDTGTETALARAPQIAVDKVAAPLEDLDGNGPDVGDRVRYSFIVSNTGNTTLTNVALTDPLTGPLACPSTSLQPGVSMTCLPGSVLVTQFDVDGGSLRNTATVTADTPLGTTVTGTDSTSTVLPASPAITLTKAAGTLFDVDGNGPDVGDTIPYTFVITNTGNTTLLGLSLTDPILGRITCPDTSLAPGASMTCTLTYAVVQDVVDAGTVSSQATVTAANAAGTRVSAAASTATPIAPRPALSLDLTVGPIQDKDGNGPDAGDTVEFRYTVTNSGNVTMSGVYVDDPEFGRVTCTPDRIAPGQSATCTPQQHVLSAAEVAGGVLPHNATAHGTSPSGATLSAVDAVSVPVKATPVAGKLSLHKRALRSKAVAGQRVRYELTVQNTGGSDLTDVRLCDVLPTNTTLLGRPNASLSRGRVCWLFDLPAGAKRAFYLTLKIDRTAKSGRLRNTATAASGTVAANAEAAVQVRAAPARKVSGTVVTG